MPQNAIHNIQPLGIQPHTIHKILLIKWSAMGDCVLATSWIAPLRQQFPQADIHVQTQPAWQSVFQNQPEINQVIAMKIRHGGLKAYQCWLKFLAEQRYDLIIDLQANDRSKILLYLARLLGITRAWRIGSHPSAIYHYAPAKPLLQQHVLTRYAAMMQALGMSPSPLLTPKLPRTTTALAHVEKCIHQYSLSQFALFFPGCSPQATAKRWPLEHFIKLAHLLLHHQLVSHIVVIGGKDEALECTTLEQAYPQQIINLCGQTSLDEVHIWCTKATFGVGNDTGLSHIAASSGLYHLTLFGPTSPILSAPSGPKAISVNTELPCQPCFKRQCCHQSCLTLISPQQIFHTLQDQKPSHYAV